MKYRLNSLIRAGQNVTLLRSTNNPRVPRKAVFLRLEPGYFYEEYTDDPLFVQSLKNWKVTVARTDAAEKALVEAGIPYEKRKGCRCTGGIKLVFPGIEVFDE